MPACSGQWWWAGGGPRRRWWQLMGQPHTHMGTGSGKRQPCSSAGRKGNWARGMSWGALVCPLSAEARACPPPPPACDARPLHPPAKLPAAAAAALGRLCSVVRKVGAHCCTCHRRRKPRTDLRSFFRSAPETLWDCPAVNGFLNMAAGSSSSHTYTPGSLCRLPATFTRASYCCSRPEVSS